MTATAPRASAGATEAPDRPVTMGVLVALGTVYLVWGSTYLAIKYVVEGGLPPFVAMGARFLLAGLVLTVPLLLVRGPAVFAMTRAQLITASVCGLFLLVGGNGLVAVAEQDVDSGLAALLIAGTPLWVVLLRAALRDRPSVATVAGLLLGLVGVALLLLPGVQGAARLGPLLLVCLSSFLWSCGTVLATRRPMPADPFVSTVVEMAVGGTTMVLLGSVGGEWGRLDLGRTEPSSWIAFGYLVLVGSVVGYSAYVWLLARAPLSLATTYAYVNPAVAVALGALFLSEPLTSNVLIGGAVIIAAVAWVITAESRSRRRPLPGREAGAPPVEPT
ncbi:EamA family transporter [Blastococcus sp. PRF04-17]|uniref:EamA family transporter n=1 Tax=Blastococcus sp. PRF04-17 TaxID=2933797 RepID=UPI001FF6D7AE|nr:EamA family transporter [Blastococcus sp. PRF04-17]UOY01590.1 EamA family transporter [Blastococcus sp. PRF04-17]